MGFQLAIFGLAVVTLAILALGGLRVADMRADQALMDALSGTTGSEPLPFETSMTDGLPEPARRFSGFALRRVPHCARLP